MAFSVFNKAIDLDVLYHPILNAIYYTVWPSLFWTFYWISVVITFIFNLFLFKTNPILHVCSLWKSFLQPLSCTFCASCHPSACLASIIQFGKEVSIVNWEVYKTMFMWLLSMSNTLAQGLFAPNSCQLIEVTSTVWSTFDAVVVKRFLHSHCTSDCIHVVFVVMSRDWYSYKEKQI